MVTGKILLTGATGFLGSQLLGRLVFENYQVTCLVRQTSDLSRIEPFLQKIQLCYADAMPLDVCMAEATPDAVIHCATDYGRKNTSVSGIVGTNLLFPLRLLELCPRYKVKCFINTDTALDRFTSHYSLSKKQFREWLEALAGDLVAVNMELEHFYGPGDDKSKFVSYLIDVFLTGSPELNLTPGEQYRDFTHVDDVVNAYLLVLKQAGQQASGFYGYSIASDAAVQIKELVGRIREFTGNTSTKVNLGAIPYRKHEKMTSDTDTTAIRGLGWRPAYSLDAGLAKTIAAEKHILK